MVKNLIFEKIINKKKEILLNFNQRNKNYFELESQS
jgi:hypothetical protein